VLEERQRSHRPDPWNTKEYGLHGREFAWFEQKLAAADGGETVATDGGDPEAPAPDDD